MALSSANVETRLVPVASRSGALQSMATAGCALVFLAGGGIDVTKSTNGCVAAMVANGVTMSSKALMLELLPVKLGTCIGPT
jgi:hypothetical protein